MLAPSKVREKEALETGSRVSPELAADTHCSPGSQSHEDGRATVKSCKGSS